MEIASVSGIRNLVDEIVTPVPVSAEVVVTTGSEYVDAIFFCTTTQFSLQSIRICAGFLTSVVFTFFFARFIFVSTKWCV